MAGESPSQPHQRLSQALARLPVADVGPQQRGERLARVRPPGSHRQVGQERLRLAGGQRPRAGLGTEEKAAQQPEIEVRHRPDG